ncbi:transcription-repair coupling factor [Stackebrandtia nassauensis DSM 44728]|uniref:Transcription-repair-coupling factor n=1 Tax=Stackebrandtia nassauensis (strain DSM 44728 / CIP 108903 / NRRL B-16338 / NBRC 102104 / LLR-40K-21) TaxID=446470 RepID=D3PZ09_STANL|nr:transcription-repair coupling factor [Stackebrandtia nassauensis]ADD45438.1 transcription-repair coupling factor [Stackebrandtia nassauensis DSM 44728]
MSSKDLSGLLNAALDEPGLARVRELAAEGGPTAEQVHVTAPAAARPFTVAALAQAERTVLAVTATSREGEELTQSLAGLLPDGSVAFYPAWETLPHERLSPRSDTVGKRLALLHRLAHPQGAPLRVVVAPVRSLLQPQLKGLGDLKPVRLAVGESTDLSDLAAELSDLAYARVDLVEKRGEFAVRGGILDIFPPTDEHPSRVEFFGDEIESIRSFAVADQRSLDKADTLFAPPCRELLLSPRVRERAAELGQQHPGLAELCEQLAQGIPVEGMESLTPALLGADQLELFVQTMPRGTVVVQCDPERIRSRAHDLVATSEEFLQASWAAAATGGKAPIDLDAAAFKSLSDVRQAASDHGCPWWSMGPFGVTEDLSPAQLEERKRARELAEITGEGFEELVVADETSVTVTATPAPLYHGNSVKVTGDVKRWTNDGWRVCLVFAGHGLAERAVEQLAEAGVGASLADSVTRPDSDGNPTAPTEPAIWASAPDDGLAGGRQPGPVGGADLNSPFTPPTASSKADAGQGGAGASGGSQAGGPADAGHSGPGSVGFGGSAATADAGHSGPGSVGFGGSAATADAGRAGGSGRAGAVAAGAAGHAVTGTVGRDGSVAVLRPGHVTVTVGGLSHGIVDEAAKLAILTGDDISGGKGATTRDMRRMPSRRKGGVNPLELSNGDYVVHEQHGVGRYIELVRRTVNGAEREYLVIEYAASKRGQPADRLFVPTDALDQLTRYVGGEMPSVHKLGGSDWQKAKSRAKKAVREIAAELIKLYAARQATEGHAFGPDTPWQRELEDAFPYQETPDQAGAIDEVKSDMMGRTPMDRLICGDVGYGKTEIAVRAAFKAVTDGKQVAVLVPTTLLASQHLNTFTERMSQFPVTIKQLSRFQTDAEAEQIRKGLIAGEVDIVVGTHRLLQTETRFKDLGLVIVDEEQRFGVEHKEKLKALRAHVDVLAMSATPIPRTLEMAITGIREMSTITTPPEERHPVLTFVGGYEDKQVGAAIRRELLRDGQVFYLHNRVESIEKAATRLREIVPEARVVVAHGKMGENRLEQIMQDFWNGEFDVLVSTTIIESGIDIPNANTLIVERADLLGLSQLHQIRGRVGRGRERAYAYFMYPPEKPLTEQAHERLATVAQHTELGAGMYVAMKDLEIRGAGNLLGGEQSGHIAGVGFDLYVRMVGDAVRTFKGAKEEILTEVKIDLPVDAHIPYDYIPVERLRLEMYRKLAEVRDDAELDEVRTEMADRYGDLPAEVDNLVHVARFRLLARAAGLSDVSLQGRHIRLSSITLSDSKQLRLKRHYPDSVYKKAAELISVPRPHTARVGGSPMEGPALLQWCAELIKDVTEAPAPAATPA